MVNVFSIGKHFSDVRSTPEGRLWVCLLVGVFPTSTDRHNSAGFVFRPQAWTFKETEQWRALRQGNFPPDFSKHTPRSAHTPTLFCKHTRSCATRAAAGLLQWTLDTVFCREGSGESVERLHEGKHKLKRCCIGIVSPSFIFRQDSKQCSL